MRTMFSDLPEQYWNTIDAIVENASWVQTVGQEHLKEFLVWLVTPGFKGDPLPTEINGIGGHITDILVSQSYSWGRAVVLTDYWLKKLDLEAQKYPDRQDVQSFVWLKHRFVEAMLHSSTVTNHAIGA